MRFKYNTSYLLYGAAFFVLAVLVVFALRQERQPSIYDEFAQCLTTRGVKMYGAWWCPHCSRQKALFDDAFDEVEYIECSAPGSKTMNQICQDAKIEGYPTWEFSDGSRLSGEQSLEDLSQKSGCPLPADQP